jgi:hypothetical protein
VHVTNRDKALFDYLFLHKIATAIQVGRDIFGVSDLHDVRRRLRGLIKSGYLRATSIVYAKQPRLAYYLSEKPFQKYILPRIERPWAQLKSDSPDHDTVLIDIRKRFLDCRNVQSFITENGIEAELDCPKGLPIQAFLEMHSDAAITYKNNDEIFHLAIEFEDAQKKRSRYEEHLTGYYVRNEIDGVIYIVKEPSLAKLLSEVDQTFCQGRPSKIFFGSLEDVLNPKEPLCFQSYSGGQIEIE